MSTTADHAVALRYLARVRAERTGREVQRRPHGLERVDDDDDDDPGQGAHAPVGSSGNGLVRPRGHERSRSIQARASCRDSKRG